MLRPFQTSVTRGKTVIAPRAELLTSRWKQAVGLMFSPQRDLVFVLREEKRIALHMAFVFYPIDVVLADSGKTVVELKERLRPFRLFLSKSRARYILELESGAVRRFTIRRGDSLSF